MITINLLPWREEQKIKRRYQQGLMFFLALFFSLSLICGLHVLLTGWLTMAQASILQSQQDLDQVNKKLAEFKEFYQSLSSPKTSILDRSSMEKHQQQVLQFLKQLADFLPDTLSLRHISFNELTWSLEGSAVIVGDVLRFVEQFKNSFKKEEGPGLLLKEKKIKISPKNSLFDYQLGYEMSL